MTVTGKQPRYLQIAGHLRELVDVGAPGGRLPSETELCDWFDVSRMTARQAVRLLVSEGLLYRRRGQGTFIASRPVPRLLGSPLSFTDSMRARGFSTSSRTLEARLIEPSPAHVQALRLDAGDRVVLVERLRLADAVPMAIERAVLAPDLAAVLDEDLDAVALHATMERMGRADAGAGPGVRPARGRARAVAARARRRRRAAVRAAGDHRPARRSLGVHRDAVRLRGRRPPRGRGRPRGPRALPAVTILAGARR